MQTLSDTKSIKAHTRPAPKKDVRKPDLRMPQAGGWTREELRALVIEILG